MTRVQVVGASLALLASAAYILHAVLRAPDVEFIRHDDRAMWITNPRPVETATLLGGAETAPQVSFERSFALEEASGESIARVRALGRVELEVNGRPVALPAGDRACFKPGCAAPITAQLRVGANQILVRLKSAAGPPLLHLHLEGAAAPQSTGPDWRVRVDGAAPVAAAVADDTRSFPGSRAVPTPAAVLRARAPLLGVLFAFSLALFGLALRLPAHQRRHLPEALLALLTLLWTYLFVVKFAQVPLLDGYDAGFHIQYLRYVAKHGELPLATQGFSMYHPPLFYGLGAGLVSLLDAARGGPLERWLFKALPFASGLGLVWTSWALARRVLPGDVRARGAAVLFAGLLPLNLYMSAYVSNEPLHALLAGLSVLAAAGALLRPERRLAPLLLLTLALGLAVLTKYTGLVVTAVVVFFVAFGLHFAERAGPRRALEAAAGVSIGVAVIGGWVYLRNWLLFGDPLVWNLDLPIGFGWWQPPGFHTPAYFLGFGESLVHPYFSGLHSFLDALYGSIWGEGIPPSAYDLDERHAVWDYDLMSGGYLLALPASALLALGIARAARFAFRGDDRGRRSFFSLVLALFYVLGLGMLAVQLRFPFWGAQRASYLLPLVAPAALCAGLGFSAADGWLAARERTLLRALLCGWAGAFAGWLALSFAS
jgi:4-amino-4-deoxy-L-arabinose transferase-like glycosyltransferase